uniref:Uncharacterized protein n=1 Tax=Anguilla anguilla TaxID=7936 RepID=A0A0E9VSM1_ANGAN
MYNRTTLHIQYLKKLHYYKTSFRGQQCLSTEFQSAISTINISTGKERPVPIT